MPENETPQYAAYQGTDLSRRGRKILNWAYATANGKVSVDVTMQEADGGYLYHASSKSELLPDPISSTDLAVLRSQIGDILNANLEARDDALWSDCIGLSLLVRDDGGYAGGPDYGRKKCEIGMTLNRVPLRVKKSTFQKGNDLHNGEVTVLAKGRELRVAQQSGDELDPGVPGQPPVRIDPDKATVVVYDTPENSEKLDQLSTMMALFSKRLQDRFAPERMREDGIPEPEDVRDMMDKAFAETMVPKDGGMKP